MKAKLVLYLIILTTNSVLLANQRIAVIGTGYVGLAIGACLADFGNTVICVDADVEKIKILLEGGIPIYEPGLMELVRKNTSNQTLQFSTDIAAAIKSSDFIFIAVGTPENEVGQADLTAVKAVASNIGENIDSYKVIVTKSTVPIGTGALIKDIIAQISHGKYPFDVVSNPEFLREGSAIKDFMEPNRVIIGVESESAKKLLEELYSPLTKKGVPLLTTNLVTAETIKYASNSFLAVKISFINEIANLCDITGADVKLVSKGMGMDNRIGHHFLSPGPGFGGSCFPKDVQALLHKGESEGISLKLLKAALDANRDQRGRIISKLADLLDGEFKNKTIAILGLAFKANTDDIRCSPAQDILEFLIQEQVNIKAYDPAAMNHMKKIYPEVEYSSSAYEAIEDADAVLILTEWDEFKKIDLELVKSKLRQPLLVDARNILNTVKLKDLGFKFLNVGNAHIE